MHTQPLLSLALLLCATAGCDDGAGSAVEPDAARADIGVVDADVDMEGSALDMTRAPDARLGGSDMAQGSDMGVADMASLVDMSPVLDMAPAPDAGHAIADQPLQGSINGVPWIVGAATSIDDPSLSDEDYLWTVVYTSAEPICRAGGDDGPGLIVPLPRQAGTYVLDPFAGFSITFVFEEDMVRQNRFDESGVLIVEEFAQTHATVALRVVSEGGDVLEGRFRTEFCPLD